MATDDQLADAITDAIEGNPTGVTRDKNKDRETEQASITELLKARGILEARSARRRGGFFARLITRRR